MSRTIAIAFTLAVAALLLALGWAGGSRWPFAALRGPETAAISRDTVVRVERDTTYLTKDSIIYVTRYAHTTDTVTLYDLRHDTVTVQVPIEHKREHYADADVWYHGFRAGIDSLAVYPLNTVVTVTEVRREKASRWGLGVQVGYGVTTQAGPVPYIGVGLSYNLLHL